MPRSGTTLVEQIITSHSLVNGAGELAYLEIYGKNIALGSSLFEERNIELLRKNYLEKLKMVSKDNTFITDKTPLNFKYVGLICKAFPEAKIIHIERDAKATCWANFKVNFGSEQMEYSYDLKDIVKFYKIYRDLMKFWTARTKNRIYNLDYEKLTLSPESEIKNIIEFLNLPWEETCLSPQNNQRFVATASLSQVRKPIYRGSSNDWEKYRPFIKNVLERVG